MIFLLNNERVLAEISMLARMHIAELLQVDPKAVTSSLELAPNGKIVVAFDVDTPVSGALELEMIQDSIAAVWLGWAKQELVDRLRGLGDVRKHGRR